MRLTRLAPAIPVAGLMIVAALALAACASGSTPTPAASVAPSVAAPSTVASAAPSSGGSGAAGGAGSVTIQNFAFQPATLDVAAGTTVTWTNQDSAQHTVTADDGSFGSDKLGTGSTFTHTFSAPGTYTYHCSIHASMKATITVH